jgi:hypothetical protein
MTTGRINQVTRQTDTRENTGDGPAKGRPPETRRISVCTILARTDTRANTGDGPAKGRPPEARRIAVRTIRGSAEADPQTAQRN